MSLTNFPEMWESRVEERLTQADVAPWLDGISEIDADVTTLGAGAATEKNIIYIPTTDFAPDVLINNTTYPLNVVEYEDGTVQITLDKYTPEVVSLTDDQVMGASYPKIDAATNTTVKAINEKKFSKAIHSIAPASNKAATPVILTTGDVFGDHKRLTYDDLVNLKNLLDTQGVPVADRRMVLCTDHWNDLLVDRKNFGNLLVDYKEGQPAPKIAGFQLYQYIDNPYFTVSTKTKLPYGAVAAATERRASVAYWTPNIAKKTGITKQYFCAAAINPRTQANELGYRHYFVATRKQEKAVGAIVSDVA